MLSTVTRAAAFAAVVVHAAKPAPPAPPTNVSDNTLICKRSELPVYGSLHKTAPKSDRHRVSESALHSNIESGVRACRKELQSGYQAVAQQAGFIVQYVETAKAHTQQTIDFLNEPQNSVHRSGAIIIGGLAGFIFASRGGFIKRVFYTGLGAGAIASLCYPRQAEENAKVVLYEGRKIFAVAYNFIKGVKPGEEVPIEPIKKFPTTLADLKYLALDLVEDAKDTLFPKKK